MPQHEGERPEPGQQRWHQVLVYFGLANPYPWEEQPSATSEVETGPRFTGWRAAVASIFVFGPPVLVAFLLRGTVAGLVATGVVAVLLALESPLGSGLRTRSRWVDEYGHLVGVVVLVNIAVSSDDLSFLRAVAYLAGWAAIVFSAFALLGQSEPERSVVADPSRGGPPAPPTVS